MVFANPWAFALLLLLPFMVWHYFKGRQRPALKYSTNRHLKLAVRPHLAWLHHLFFIFRIAALVGLIVTIARPQFGKSDIKRHTEGLDIVLVVDTSGSMEAMDFELNGKRYDRLTVVKTVISDFIGKRIDDRIGMVVFGSEAFTQAPLTLDHTVLLNFLEHIRIGMAGTATAIGDGIATATKRLKDLEAKSKIIILLTDGSNTAGEVDPLEAAQAAATLGVKIYTIAVGSDGQAPFPVNGLFGRSFQYQEVEIDEKLLEEIAKLTGGQFYRAKDTQTLVNIYETIDRLEKTKVEVKEHVDYEEAFPIFLWPAFSLLVLEILLGLTRFRRLP